MSSKHIGIHSARPILGDLVTAVQQGADVVLTRNGKPAARIIRYQEAIAMLATVARAGTITDKNRIAVDQTLDGTVIATPFLLDLTVQQIQDGADEWDDILAATGWTVTTGWTDHDGYWTAEVEEASRSTVLRHLAERLMAGKQIKHTEIDPNGGVRRLRCCGVPVGTARNHDFPTCVADLLTRGEDADEIRLGVKLGTWAGEQAYR